MDSRVAEELLAELSDEALEECLEAASEEEGEEEVEGVAEVTPSTPPQRRLRPAHTFSPFSGSESDSVVAACASPIPPARDGDDFFVNADTCSLPEDDRGEFAHIASGGGTNVTPLFGEVATSPADQIHTTFSGQSVAMTFVGVRGDDAGDEVDDGDGDDDDDDGELELTEMFPDNGVFGSAVLADQLYVGAVPAMRNGPWLIEAGIGMIIDLSARSGGSSSQLRAALADSGIQYRRGPQVHFDASDALSLVRVAPKIVNMTSLEEGGSKQAVLCVDGQLGTGQAAIVSLALLMYCQDFTYDDALTRVSEAVEDVTSVNLESLIDYSILQYLQGDFAAHAEKHAESVHAATKEAKASREIQSVIEGVHALDGGYWQMSSTSGRRSTKRAAGEEIGDQIEEPSSNAAPAKRQRPRHEGLDVTNSAPSSDVKQSVPLTKLLSSWIHFEEFARPFVDSLGVLDFENAVESLYATRDEETLLKHVFRALCCAHPTARDAVLAHAPNWDPEREYASFPHNLQFEVTTLLAGASDGVRSAAGVPAARSRRKPRIESLEPAPSLASVQATPKVSVKKETVAIPPSENSENGEGPDLDGEYWRVEGSSRTRRAKLLGSAARVDVFDSFQALLEHATSLYERCVSDHIGDRTKIRALTPNGYFHRYCVPGESVRTGPWTAREHRVFIGQLRVSPLVEIARESSAGIVIASSNSLCENWGLFSIHVSGRQGFQCFHYYKEMLVSGVVADPAFRVVNGKAVLATKKRVQKRASTPQAPVPAQAAVNAREKTIDRKKRDSNVEKLKQLTISQAQNRRAQALAAKLQKRRVARESDLLELERRRAEREQFLINQANEQDVGHAVCSRGNSSLFLGGKHAAGNIGWLLDARVTLVVNCTTDTRNFVSLASPEVQAKVDFLRLTLKDSIHQPVLSHPHFENTLERIHEHLTSDRGSLLVHCAEGRSRSVMMCMCYLMRYRDFSLKAAMERLSEIRRYTEPRLNQGFQVQLMEFERNVAMNGNSGIEFTPTINFLDLGIRGGRRSANRNQLAVVSKDAREYLPGASSTDDKITVDKSMQDLTKNDEGSGSSFLLTGGGETSSSVTPEQQVLSPVQSFQAQVAGHERKDEDVVLVKVEQAQPAAPLGSSSRPLPVDEAALDGISGKGEMGSTFAPGPPSGDGSRFFRCSACEKTISVFDRTFHEKLECGKAQRSLVQTSVYGGIAPTVGDWARATADGECYYYNLVTRETAWSLPKDAKLRHPTAPPRPAIRELEDDVSGDTDQTEMVDVV